MRDQLLPDVLLRVLLTWIAMDTRHRPAPISDFSRGFADGRRAYRAPHLASATDARMVERRENLRFAPNFDLDRDFVV